MCEFHNGFVPTELLISVLSLIQITAHASKIFLLIDRIAVIIEVMKRTKMPSDADRLELFLD